MWVFISELLCFLHIAPAQADKPSLLYHIPLHIPPVVPPARIKPWLAFHPSNGCGASCRLRGAAGVTRTFWEQVLAVPWCAFLPPPPVPAQELEARVGQQLFYTWVWVVCQADTEQCLPCRAGADLGPLVLCSAASVDLQHSLWVQIIHLCAGESRSRWPEGFFTCWVVQGFSACRGCCGSLCSVTPAWLRLGEAVTQTSPTPLSLHSSLSLASPSFSAILLWCLPGVPASRHLLLGPLQLCSVIPALLHLYLPLWWFGSILVSLQIPQGCSLACGWGTQALLAMICSENQLWWGKVNCSGVGTAISCSSAGSSQNGMRSQGTKFTSVQKTCAIVQILFNLLDQGMLCPGPWNIET